MQMEIDTGKSEQERLVDQVRQLQEYVETETLASKTAAAEVCVLCVFIAPSFSLSLSLFLSPSLCLPSECVLCVYVCVCVLCVCVCL